VNERFVLRSKLTFFPYPFSFAVVMDAINLRLIEPHLLRKSL
jgi:hypothetical protein